MLDCYSKNQHIYCIYFWSQLSARISSIHAPTLCLHRNFTEHIYMYICVCTTISITIYYYYYLIILGFECMQVIDRAALSDRHVLYHNACFLLPWLLASLSSSRAPPLSIFGVMLDSDTANMATFRVSQGLPPSFKTSLQKLKQRLNPGDITKALSIDLYCQWNRHC